MVIIRTGMLNLEDKNSGTWMPVHTMPVLTSKHNPVGNKIVVLDPSGREPI